jgi:hypothetical protein
VVQAFAAQAPRLPRWLLPPRRRAHPRQRPRWLGAVVPLCPLPGRFARKTNGLSVGGELDPRRKEFTERGLVLLHPPGRDSPQAGPLTTASLRGLRGAQIERGLGCCGDSALYAGYPRPLQDRLRLSRTGEGHWGCGKMASRADADEQHS